MSLLNKYNDLPVLAKWKALILEYGIDLAQTDLIGNYPDIEKFKTKYRVKIPAVTNFKFMDKSKDNSLIPSELILRDDDKRTLVKCGYRKNSPIILNSISGKLVLQERGTINEMPIKFELVKKRDYFDKRLPIEINSNQAYFEDFVQIVGLDRIAILAFEGCWHWISGKPCLFCDAQPRRCDNTSAMPSLNNLIDNNFNENDWWEKYRKNYLAGIKYVFNYIIRNEKIEPHRHFQLMSGNMPHTAKVWSICREITDIINDIYPISDMDSYLNLAAPRENLESTLMMAKKEMGFNQIEFNLEVYSKERFEEVCPGKSALAGYDNTLNALKIAAGIFGPGKARSNFVLGAQPVEELLSGIKELAKFGIAADYSIFVPKKGTAWENRESLSMEEIVIFTKELAKIYKENNFTSIYCGLSSRSNILYEILNY
jgi:hypothetical protein